MIARTRRVPPSFDHEVLVELFRNCGPLAPALLHLCGRAVLAHDRVDVRSIDFSQISSTEYRADAVVELSDQTGTAIAGVIVEVQLKPDDDKRYSWPLYVASLRAKLRCPVTVFVLTPSAAVARWAREPIELGHPGFALEPIVIELDEVPESIDLVHAQKLPELAVLSAIAHPGFDTAMTALAAIASLPTDRRKLYFDLVLARLPAPSRQSILESLMLQGYKYQSEFALRYYNQGHEEGRNQGHEEGREEGRNQGREEGRNQGREDGLRAALLALAPTRLAAFTDEDAVAIHALRGEQALTALVTALGQATTPAEARTSFDLVIHKLQHA
jgi:hypothetical protein